MRSTLTIPICLSLALHASLVMALVRLSSLSHPQAQPAFVTISLSALPMAQSGQSDAPTIAQRGTQISELKEQPAVNTIVAANAPSAVPSTRSSDATVSVNGNISTIPSADVAQLAAGSSPPVPTPVVPEAPPASSTLDNQPSTPPTDAEPETPSRIAEAENNPPAAILSRQSDTLAGGNELQIAQATPASSALDNQPSMPPTNAEPETPGRIAASENNPPAAILSRQPDTLAGGNELQIAQATPASPSEVDHRPDEQIGSAAQPIIADEPSSPHVASLVAQPVPTAQAISKANQVEASAIPEGRAATVSAIQPAMSGALVTMSSAQPGGAPVSAPTVTETIEATARQGEEAAILPGSTVSALAPATVVQLPVVSQDASDQAAAGQSVSAMNVAGLAERAKRFVDTYDGGDCFYATALKIASDTANIDGFSAEDESYSRFHQGFIAALGFEPAVIGQTVRSSQCPAVNFLREISKNGETPPVLDIDEVHVPGGTSLRGTVRDFGTRDVALLQVSADGSVHDLSARLRDQGDVKRFTLPMPRMEPGGPYPELLVAITRARGSAPPDIRKPSDAHAVFDAALAEARRRGERPTAAAKLFLLDD